ncbi:MAG TPA: signal recognition particle-docking protein FtsY [Polyangia bacterium]|nr:signal recognition particle-docking protein FtsY [Polyangia bacterium]
MDLSSIHLTPTELYELIGVVGGLGVTGSLGVLFVRRARAVRRRQIEESEEAPALPGGEERAAKPGRSRAEPEAQPEPAPARGTAARGSAAAPARAPEPRPAPLPAPEAEPRSAQVIPFPAPAPAPEPAPAPKKKVSALAPGLARTRSGFVARLGAVFSGRKQIDPAVVDEIEKVLLTADIGVRTSQKLLEEIRSSLSRSELKDPDAVWAFLRQRSTEMLALPAPPLDFNAAKPFVLLVIGVNGSGKTTTIGKLAAALTGEGKKVMMAAGDTFRAAAAEQLEIWAGRTGASIVRGKEGADPSSVIFDGIKKAATEGYDVAIADTAGRLHTKTDLMQELQKVRRVVGKAAAGAPHETWLVIDSTSGQNAIAQAQIFTEAMSVSGIVLTKLDGTAKGGVILGIADQLKIPVRYVGVGEKVEDLRPFDPAEFVEALFAPLEN